jgi:glycosyltransferase involved in cell wall biosynthesis
MMLAPPLLHEGRNRPSSVIILNDHGWVSGGQAKIAIESALQLKHRGIDVCFIAGVGPVDARLPEAGIECRAVGSADILSDTNRVRAAVHGIWNPSAARVLSQCIAERDPESTVIHVHGWAKSLSPSIGPVVTGSKAAHVYTLHEYFLSCPNGGFYDYQAQSICTRRPLGMDCLTTQCDSRGSHHKMWRVARQAVLWSAGRMPGGLREIIYIAPEQLKILGPSMPAEARWHHLPNPVGQQPEQRIAAERNDTFLFIGRLSPEKGAAVAARAAKIAGVPIALCGDGDQRETVLRANPDAQMPGWLSEDELRDWMSRARCLVFPSLWYECYPLVVADALRAGLPVLVADTSLAASLVENGVAGRHVPAGDVRAWAGAMAACESDELVRNYSEAAFRAGQSLIDDDTYVSRLVDIYADALSRKQTESTASGKLVR